MPTDRPANPSRPHEEIWECTIPGRVSLVITNERGGTRHQTVNGEGRVLRITTMDREMAEEVIRKPENNPFRNGALVRVDTNRADYVGSPDELTSDELKEMFDLDKDDFENIVPTLSELNVRRLKGMAVEVNARNSQITFLNDYIAEKYAIGGAMPSYMEMQATPL